MHFKYAYLKLAQEFIHVS